MTIEVLNVLGQMVPHTRVPIVGDGACLFRALSYLMYDSHGYAGTWPNRGACGE